MKRAFAKRSGLPGWIKPFVRLGAAYLMLVGFAATLVGIGRDYRDDHLRWCLSGAVADSDKLACYESYLSDRNDD